MRIKVTNKYWTIDQIREIVSVVKPKGIKNFDVMIKNSSTKKWCGRAYTEGSDAHDRGCPFIIVRMNHKIEFPLDMHYRGKGPKFPTTKIDSEKELMVYFIAHELRHLWQAKMKNKRGYYKGSKGKFSDYDCEMYAKDQLIKWRVYSNIRLLGGINQKLLEIV